MSHAPEDESPSRVEHGADRDGPRQAIPGYQLLAKVGAGSIGTVYKARQVSLDRMVAIKVLHPRLARRSQFAERFVKEARTLARLAHPNIVTPIDVGFTGRFYHLVMEFLDGKTVAQLLLRGGSLDEKRTLGIVYQVSLALEHVADHDMVHRDVKPHNIILSKVGTAKLCDLGFALLRREIEGEEGATGTPHYISPEQAQGQAADIRTDIYSLGATLYHMIVGRPPFEGDDAGAVIARHVSERPASPAKLRRDLHPDTCRLIERMLEKRPDRRPQRPREVAKEIERILMDMGASPYDTAVRPPRGDANARRGSDPSMRAYRGTLDPAWPRGASDTSVPQPAPPPLPSTSRPTPPAMEAPRPKRPAESPPPPRPEPPRAPDPRPEAPRIARLGAKAARYRGIVATSRRKRRGKKDPPG